MWSELASGRSVLTTQKEWFASLEKGRTDMKKMFAVWLTLLAITGVVEAQIPNGHFIRFQLCKAVSDPAVNQTPVSKATDAGTQAGEKEYKDTVQQQQPP